MGGWGSRWWCGGDCEGLTDTGVARELYGVMEVFYFLSVMVFTGMFTFVEIHKLYI